MSSTNPYGPPPMPLPPPQGRPFQSPGAAGSVPAGPVPAPWRPLLTALFAVATIIGPLYAYNNLAGAYRTFGPLAGRSARPYASGVARDTARLTESFVFQLAGGCAGALLAAGGFLGLAGARAGRGLVLAAVTVMALAELCTFAFLAVPTYFPSGGTGFAPGRDLQFLLTSLQTFLRNQIYPLVCWVALARRG